MKDCAPCPLYEHCSTEITYQRASLDATRGRLRGAHLLMELVENVGEDAAYESIDELGGISLARYLYDDNAYDSESMNQALETFEQYEPELRHEYQEVVVEIETEIGQLATMLESVQANCQGPRSVQRRRWFQREDDVSCSADRGVLAAQTHPIAGKHGYSLTEVRAQIRTYQFEATGNRFYISAMQIAKPTIPLGTATLLTTMADALFDNKLNAPAWVYQAELYPLGAGTLAVIALGGLGRACHGIAKVYDRKSKQR